MISIKFRLCLSAVFIFSISSSFLLKPIIGRHDVEDNRFILLAKKYPETLSLFYFNDTDMAGTLIAKNWLLSAAHVASDLTPGDSIRSINKKYRIEHIYIHPEWKHDQAYDLALIKIDMDHDSIPPVALYRKRDESGKTVLIAGHGDSGNGLTGPVRRDGKLRAATNRIDETTDFWLKWDFDNPETDSAAATEMEGISGPGDSSGPAFIFIDGQGFLAGISSGQSTRATQGKEGVYGVREYYVRVSSYIDWITSTIAKE
jgi:Trypsin